MFPRKNLHSFLSLKTTQNKHKTQTKAPCTAFLFKPSIVNTQVLTRK